MYHLWRFLSWPLRHRLAYRLLQAHVVNQGTCTHGALVKIARIQAAVFYHAHPEQWGRP